MTDKRDTGPLSSDELERDRERSGQEDGVADELAGDQRGQPTDRDDDGGRAGPNPIAGTMLPPD